MHFLFVHLPGESDGVAIGSALALADAHLLAGVADTIKEGSLTAGRCWLAAFEAAAAEAASDRLAAALAGIEGATALRIEGNGADLSLAETAFIVANHTVTDAERFEPYIAAVGPVTARYGGRFLARAGRTERIAGEIDAGRSVILAFADRAAAERFYAAPDYAPLLELRLATTRPNMILAAET